MPWSGTATCSTPAVTADVPLPGVFCPHCGESAEAYHFPDGSAPDAGAIAICIMCGLAARYIRTVYGLSLRMCTPEEVELIRQSPAYQQAMAYIAAQRRAHPNRGRNYDW